MDGWTVVDGKRVTYCPLFRPIEPFTHLDEDGASNLRIGILRQAVADYEYGCEGRANEVERFVNSDDFDGSLIAPDRLLKVLKEKRMRRNCAGRPSGRAPLADE